MSLYIEPVKNRQALKEFVIFPFHIYRDHDCWVPPLIGGELKKLDKGKNTVFRFCEAEYWLARKDDRVVGRVAGVINHRFNQKYDMNAVRFGRIDFIDEPEISRVLLQTVEDWAREKGMDTVLGPLGFTNFDGGGALVAGFDELSTFDAPYNYKYYPQHFEQHGYNKYFDWVEYQMRVPDQVPERVERLAAAVQRRLKVRFLHAKTKKQLMPFARDLFDVVNSAFSSLFGFVELDDRQIDSFIHEFFSFIDPQFVPVILDDRDKVAAFGVTIPSLSLGMQRAGGRLLPFGWYHLRKAMKTYQTIDLMLTAVRPDLQNKGLNALLLVEMNRLFIEKGVQFVETNRELEDNTKVQGQWKFYNPHLHKRRRCFIKEL